MSIAPENIKKFEKEMGEIVYAKIGMVSKNDKFIIFDNKNKKIVNTNVKKLYGIYHKFSNSMK